MPSRQVRLNHILTSPCPIWPSLFFTNIISLYNTQWIYYIIIFVDLPDAMNKSLRLGYFLHPNRPVRRCLSEFQVLRLLARQDCRTYLDIVSFFILVLGELTKLKHILWSLWQDICKRSSRIDSLPASLVDDVFLLYASKLQTKF